MLWERDYNDPTISWWQQARIELPNCPRRSVSMPLSHSATSTTHFVNQSLIHSCSRKVNIFPGQCYLIQELSFAQRCFTTNILSQMLWLLLRKWLAVRRWASPGHAHGLLKSVFFNEDISGCSHKGVIKVCPSSYTQWDYSCLKLDFDRLSIFLCADLVDWLCSEWRKGCFWDPFLGALGSVSGAHFKIWWFVP